MIFVAGGYKTSGLVPTLRLCHDFLMYGKRFEKELQLINAALADEEGEIVLRRYMTPYVESVVVAYIAEHRIDGLSKATLMNASWRYFSTAIRKYKGRAELMLQGKNDLFYFSSYFTWFIRQGILEYLQEKGPTCK